MASQSKKPKNKDAQLVDLFHHCAQSLSIAETDPVGAPAPCRRC